MINYNFSSYSVGDLVTVNVDKPKECEPETPFFDDFEQKAEESHKAFEEAKLLYVKLRKCDYTRREIKAFTGWGLGRIDRLARWYNMSGYGD
nr:hypothetical protein LBZUJACN_LBZUJACN_CDS_0034 [Caudoviricetes sp.]CAI9751035.1 hypothetical protein MIHLRAQX_MIHLRAQX_CDS_0034 [Caudoviricetes sp.]